MNNAFWLNRWQQHRIGFHRSGIHPLLEKFWHQLAAGTDTVLVPLCGKSHDLDWLARRGHEVVGVELSDVAAREFGQEHGLRFHTSKEGRFTRMQAGRVTYLIGDFFTLSPVQAGRFGLAYDRAALIALPSERRQAYADILKVLLESNGHILLITIEWDIDPNEGPPWSVGAAEVRKLFSDFSIRCLEERDCLDEEPRFRERGATWMREVAWHLHLPPATPDR